MPIRRLPGQPNIDQLRSQARTLQRRVRDGEAQALALVRGMHPRLAAIVDGSAEATAFTRADALLVVARSYGFASWPALHSVLALIDRFTRSPHRQPVGASGASAHDQADEFLQFACLTYSDDDPGRWAAAGERLAAYPDIAASSIYTAAAVGDVAAARRLLGADPGAANRQGGPHRWEPLLYLTYSRVDSAAPGHSAVEVARLLLDHGADPNAGYLWDGLPSPFTALTGAFGRGEGDQPPHRHCLELADMLLAAGADPNDSQALYNCGLGPGPDDYLRLLLRYGLGRGDGGVWHQRLGHLHPTPAELLQDELLKAARRNLADRARLLLDHGVDLDGTGTAHPSFEGYRAWELATLLGHADIAGLLAAAGASAGPDPVIGFLGACMRADRGAVDRLRAADPSLPHRAIACRPHHLTTAAAHGHTAAVRLMAELGFDVNHLRRGTPLHEAAYAGHLATVRALIALGADPTRTDPSYHATPQGWAEHADRRAVVDYLATLGPRRTG
ncbi:MAG TPA: ankyrin repeat domain-containing protein [Pilimelia sp.]|nr:ankyrin repeat domain-containing protein [Pilimelia sp.]